MKERDEFIGRMVKLGYTLEWAEARWTKIQETKAEVERDMAKHAEQTKELAEFGIKAEPANGFFGLLVLRSSQAGKLIRLLRKRGARVAPGE